MKRIFKSNDSLWFVAWILNIIVFNLSLKFKEYWTLGIFSFVMMSLIALITLTVFRIRERDNKATSKTARSELAAPIEDNKKGFK